MGMKKSEKNPLNFYILEPLNTQKEEKANYLSDNNIKHLGIKRRQEMIFIEHIGVRHYFKNLVNGLFISYFIQP